ncbi:uncharacterized protein BKA55DRAFT_600130 [Fusarium redolens]|uniref:Uncharacterized protein n=1 Tax=Fusarium redolens TaxID=48865 RepID=A0A9P9FWG1_FUSRE|nr:uncharacterized protein BKA55DRAFT_600130 [Fusarium redolens]KAH7207890.1 hypothetical protein BKA55DRAFT_600130 [Fusarium redolens]
MTPSIEPVIVSVALCVFIIKGGVLGIGAAIARIIAKFKQIKDELEAINPYTKVFTEYVDVSSSSSSGAIHGCLNAAGVAQVMSDPSSIELMILQERDEGIERVINVNYKGVVYCTRSYPSIVNIASLASLMHIPGGYICSTSKAASTGIRLNAVSPGNILTLITRKFVPADADTDLMAKNAAAAGLSSLDLYDVVRTIVWLLSEASIYVNGINLAVGTIVL